MTTAMPVERRPTPLEDEAHRAMIREFSDQMQQFAAASVAIADVATKAPRLSLDPSEDVAREHAAASVRADDGNQWTVGRELMDDVLVCQRTTERGEEFAIVARLKIKDCVGHSVLSTGSNLQEALQNFVTSERAALHLWAEDFSAQVQERLAMKYPGEDLRRVSEAIQRRFSETRLPRRSIRLVHAQRRARGMKV